MPPAHRSAGAGAVPPRGDGAAQDGRVPHCSGATGSLVPTPPPPSPATQAGRGVPSLQLGSPARHLAPPYPPSRLPGNTRRLSAVCRPIPSAVLWRQRFRAMATPQRMRLSPEALRDGLGPVCGHPAAAANPPPPAQQGSWHRCTETLPCPMFQTPPSGRLLDFHSK